jgi:pimeloyl-ACP methyl ester carboxylesterase
VPYVEVAGSRVWHEVTGDGEPVALLHGAFSGASSLSQQTPALAAAGFRVHVPERRGHAHTADVPGPLTYSVMADDTIAYLDQEVGPSHVLGWSDGAVVGLLVALRRSDLVRRLVLIGQYYNFSGRVPDSPLDAVLASPEAKGLLRREYDVVSPDGPDHFDVVYDKTMHMLNTEPTIDLADLSAVVAPTLVLQGDRDEVTLEHSQAVVAALPDARLAVLPGTHGLPLEAPDVVNALLVWFLRGAESQSPWGDPPSTASRTGLQGAGPARDLEGSRLEQGLRHE